MIRLLLFVFLICIANHFGIARNGMDLSGSGLSCCQSKSLSEFISDYDLIFFDCILENASFEANLIFDIQKDLFSTHPVIIGKNRISVNSKDINLLCFIRKDYIFLSILRL